MIIKTFTDLLFFFFIFNLKEFIKTIKKNKLKNKVFKETKSNKRTKKLKSTKFFKFFLFFYDDNYSSASEIMKSTLPFPENFKFF